MKTAWRIVRKDHAIEDPVSGKIRMMYTHILFTLSDQVSDTERVRHQITWKHPIPPDWYIAFLERCEANAH